MLITIWGRDGSGKSSLADAIGALLAQKDLVAIIDTDLTQPILPVRMPGTRFGRENSLGRAISGTGSSEVKRYFHLHPKKEGLFYAGLITEDDYLSFEIGLEAETAANLFISNCQEIVDHVILDCSGQRTDPFVPGALVKSERILILLTPDLHGICWWKSIRPLLIRMNVMDKVWPILSPVHKYHQADWICEAIETSCRAELPFSAELNLLRCCGKPSEAAISRSGRRWNKKITLLCEDLQHQEVIRHDQNPSLHRL